MLSIKKNNETNENGVNEFKQTLCGFSTKHWLAVPVIGTIFWGK
jgi:hypothetical protein